MSLGGLHSMWLYSGMAAPFAAAAAAAHRTRCTLAMPVPGSRDHSLMLFPYPADRNMARIVADAVVALKHGQPPARLLNAPERPRGAAAEAAAAGGAGACNN